MTRILEQICRGLRTGQVPSILRRAQPFPGVSVLLPLARHTFPWAWCPSTERAERCGDVTQSVTVPGYTTAEDTRQWYHDAVNALSLIERTLHNSRQLKYTVCSVTQMNFCFWPANHTLNSNGVESCTPPLPLQAAFCTTSLYSTTVFEKARDPAHICTPCLGSLNSICSTLLEFGW
jgi:hypothetical protein